ncbi:MAG: putative membrane protein [Flavobacteriales bacterium]|jgi:putative membrane protein
MNFLMRLLISGSAVLLSSYLIDGVVVSGFISALMVALFLGLLNVIFKPLLVLLTIPITVLTLGLFLFVINAIIVLMVDGVVSGFSVSSIWTAILFSFILSLITSVLEAVFDVKKPRE